MEYPILFCEYRSGKSQLHWFEVYSLHIAYSNIMAIYHVLIQFFPIGGNIVLDFTQAVFVDDEDDLDVDICMRLSGLPAGGLECDLVVPLILMDGKASESLNSHT